MVFVAKMWNVSKQALDRKIRLQEKARSYFTINRRRICRPKDWTH
jgi:hypothetical protein